jgi:hypothetical protein
MANSIFHDLIAQGVVLVYLEDILVHTASWQQHLLVLSQILQRIHEFNLQLQFRKCKWGCTQLKFLGFLISEAGIRMDPAKIIALTEFAPPTSVKTLQSFLGLINFSLRFIPNLAAINLPQLLQKNTPFLWTTACQRSFQQLKDMVRDAMSLAHLDFNKPFKLQTDASNAGLGAVLLQQTRLDDW